MSTRKPLSREYLISRGSCCGSGCMHCPYIPSHVEGSIDVGRACPQCGMAMPTYFMDGGRDATCDHCGYKFPCCGD